VHLGREAHGLPALGPVERLDADRVTGGDEAVAAGGDEGEHPVQLGQRDRPALVDQVQRHLVVRVGGEVAMRQRLADLLVVVDLAVPDQVQVAVGARQRLLAAADVDDRQAGVAQPAPVELDRPAVVRTAVRYALEHLLELFEIDAAVLGDYSAHVFGSTRSVA
jgi:hypothetical protein